MIAATLELLHEGGCPSRWELTGINRGFGGTEADGRPVHMTGTAVWAVRADGRLDHNRVARNALEVYLRLSAWSRACPPLSAGQRGAPLVGRSATARWRSR